MRRSGVWLPTAVLFCAAPLFSDLAHAQEAGANYALTPTYRASAPEDAVLSKISASADGIPPESHSERALALLDEFSNKLLETPTNGSKVEELLAAGFTGTHLTGPEEQLRSDGPLHIVQSDSVGPGKLTREQFAEEFVSLLSGHTQILLADFEVIAASLTESAGRPVFETTVHYDFVGIPPTGWRLQQSGLWELTWSRQDEDWRIAKWSAGTQTRVLSHRPAFEDVTEYALGGNATYQAQLKLGVDQWRARLDGSIGVDVYGHHGVSVGDYDGDGDDDIYVSQPAGLPNRLFQNEGGLNFTDVTDEAGVAVLDSTSMSLFADVDNDGDQDLLVIAAIKPLLFVSDGHGTFRHSADAFRFDAPPRAQLTSAAMSDYDRDGDLDLYLCSYRHHLGAGQQEPPTPYHDANNGPPNFLLRNDGDGAFEDVTNKSGLGENNTRFSFAASWEDYDQDGWPDLYVANDFGRNNLYRNNGDGTFRDAAPEAGVEDIGAGMSAAWLDYDRDGLSDLYVGNMWSSAGLRITGQEEFLTAAQGAVRDSYERHAKGNSLFRNLGNGSFQEVSRGAGVERGHWAWASDGVDIDNDGYQDLYVADGYITNEDTKDL